jgi:iron complex transport system ATP-binding protein
VLWATHDLNEALDLADHIVMLREGRLLGAGTVSECVSPPSLEETFGVPARIESDASGRMRVSFFR